MGCSAGRTSYLGVQYIKTTGLGVKVTLFGGTKLLLVGHRYWIIRWRGSKSSKAHYYDFGIKGALKAAKQ